MLIDFERSRTTTNPPDIYYDIFRLLQNCASLEKSEIALALDYSAVNALSQYDGPVDAEAYALVARIIDGISIRYAKSR